MAAALFCRALAAQADDGCDASLKWFEDGNLATAHYREPAFDISMRQYQDAVRVDYAGPHGEVKGILHLLNGPELIIGSSDPREFLDAGQSAFIPVYYLMQHYASPCAVPADDTVADARAYAPQPKH
jgi:hypothetical protein